MRKTWTIGTVVGLCLATFILAGAPSASAACNSGLWANVCAYGINQGGSIQCHGQHGSRLPLMEGYLECYSDGGGSSADCDGSLSCQTTAEGEARCARIYGETSNALETVGTIPYEMCAPNTSDLDALLCLVPLLAPPDCLEPEP